MSHRGWTRHDDGDRAVDELLDAAGRVFADSGVANAKMIDVARDAGCSRATLYRYFPNRSALQLAFVHRATLRIAERMAADRRAGGGDSAADRIMTGIEAVRSDPLLAVWFEPENVAVPMAVSQNSELLQAMATGLTGELDSTPPEPDELERRGEWLLRSVVSLLAMPGTDAVAERLMVDSFLVPVLTSQNRSLETR